MRGSQVRHLAGRCGRKLDGAAGMRRTGVRPIVAVTTSRVSWPRPAVRLSGQRAGNYAALARVDVSEVPENRTGRPTTTFPVPWSPAHPPAVPGPRETPAVARCVDPRRSASRLGVRSTRPSARDVPRPVRGTERHAAAATVPRHSRGGVCGSTRPAPDGRSPYRPAEAATRPPPRRRRLGALPNRP